MSHMFEQKSREEFLKGVDRGLMQAKNSQRMDAKASVRDMSMELRAGYQAMSKEHNANKRMAANS